jgi:hypothetical protein
VDKVAGFLEVGRTDDTHKIVINLSALKPDADGLGHIVLLPQQARHLANVLIENASYAEAETRGLVPESRTYRRLKRDRKS